LSGLNRGCKYIKYNILKINIIYKHAIVYISEKYKQIIIAPCYFENNGINYEQEVCYLFDINIDDETLGTEIINALNKYAYKDKYLGDDKLSDWPAYKYSKLKTVKSFNENYPYISIAGDKNGYIYFLVKYPKNEYGYNREISKIKNNANYSDIGKEIKEIHAMSEEDIKIKYMEQNITYKKIETAEEIQGAKNLIIEYVRWLDHDLDYQNIDYELNNFPEKYKEPEGAFIVAKDGNAVIGCVGIRKLEENICEMKRLFVNDHYKGLGIGRKLVEKIIEEAKTKNYKKMRLDTLSTMEAALKMYYKNDFYKIKPYYNNPNDNAEYLEKIL
jgi:ribosomal protein S18 acetylase RimI-like enzyme